MKSCVRLAFGLFLIASNFSVARAETGTNEFLPPVPEGRTWKLAWHDEFDGEKLDDGNARMGIPQAVEIRNAKASALLCPISA